jgi:NADH dehydrogenase FAD-containing subunit
LSDGKEMNVGMIVWATGIAPSDFIRNIESFQKEVKTGKLLTDDFLNVIGKDDGRPIKEIFAIGDCSSTQGNPLPATAQVAKQQAKYLLKHLGGVSSAPFEYKYHGSMAYIGGWRAIVDQTRAPTGIVTGGWWAWVFWRSAYFSMSVSWRNKALIPMYWFLAWAFGRDITNI